MLSSLHIENYILIDSLDIGFPEGLVIITGQTGAGKSILMGALGLLAGARADAGVISGGADSCIVEAEFDSVPEHLREVLEENGAEWDGGHLIIRRVVHRSGRSRSFVNDSPVQVGVLHDISDSLFDIHSQHRSLLLTDRSFQLSLLDHYAGNSSLLQECRASWGRYQALKSELEESLLALQRLDADSDYNMAQFRQLEAAHINPGELGALEEEHKALSNAGQIKESLTEAMNIFEPAQALSVSASLKEIRRRLELVAKYVPIASDLSSRMDSARIELEDIFSEISDMNSSVDLSSERLSQVEERMSCLYSLLKKHGCSDEEELASVRDALEKSLVDSSDLEEKKSELQKRLESEYGKYAELCKALSRERKAACEPFACEIVESLKSLELERSAFEVAVEPASEGPSGTDRVTFLFSSDGNAPVDLSKCASGGEMSRIMLSLKAMMAKFTGMPTLVFDEIDTGVSGSVADSMGRMICSMGENMQIFAITHLPQVAAKGEAHYVVSKSINQDGRSVSRVSRVQGEDRVNEIARLLSGAEISEAAVRNARALLDAR